MAKVKTVEQLEKERFRNERELARLQREKAKPRLPGYIAYFVLIITVVYMVDEITTQISSQMQTIVGHELFAPLVGEDVAVARLTLVGTLTTLTQVFAFFYKTLSDRYGRKIFLVLNTLGMGIGMLITALALNIPAYVVGALFIAFFTPHDMQAVYIQECAPAEKRARMYSVIKCFATLSLLLVPLLRSIFITDTDWSGWRGVYLVPAIIAFVITVAAYFFMRETDVFLDSRIHQLTMTEEEKASELAKANEEASQGGLFKGIGYAFKHRQTRWLFIASSMLMLGFCLTNYYENTMYYGFASGYLAEGMDLVEAKQLVTPLVNQALFLFPIGSALIQLMPGFIADKFGRKTAAAGMSLICLVTFVLFYIGANNGMSPYLVGFLAGAAVGSYWAAGDMQELMIGESSPTNVRVSIITARSIVSGVLFVVSGALTTALANILGDEKIAIVCLIFAVPSVILALISMIFVKETRGADMSTVRFTDYD